tara:strand:- start:10717 stop:11949 length:1233 start_codon:yes stop_codon:yes gene_type:complete
MKPEIHEHQNTSIMSKKIFIICAVLFMTASVLFPQQANAQTPEKMSYQAVVRDDSNNLVTSTQVGMQFSILQGSETGTAVYVETQTPTTNDNGLATVEIGDGTVEEGDFTTIDWEDGPFFIKTETDPEGGTNYTISGTSQLLSTPYALHAKTAETISGEIIETDPSVPDGNQIGEIQYWDGSEWVTLPPEDDGAVLTLVSGIPSWEEAGGGGVPSVINPDTGEEWMDRNLGASQVATAIDDADSFGGLYQWGRGADGHGSRTSGISSTLSDSDDPGHGDFITATSSPLDWRSPQNDDLWQGVNGTNNPCPSGYRVPTATEWEAEFLSWDTQDAAGAFASPLKLTKGGHRIFANGVISLFPGYGGYGTYWTSTVSGTGANNVGFKTDPGSQEVGIYTNFRAYGYSVRCIKD